VRRARRPAICNLYSLTPKRDHVGRFFRVSHNRTVAFEPVNTIFPRHVTPVVRQSEDGEREIVLMNWGFFRLEKGKAPRSVTNVRDDQIRTNPFWRDSFQKRRCLVPADGFYEWRKDKSDKRPWRIVDAERPAFAFAGVWEGWRNPAGEIVRSFAIVTTDANEKLAPIHDRMPVMLKREDEDAWLDPGSSEPTLASLLAPYDTAKTELYRVDARVNSVKNDDPECLAKVEQ